MTIKNRRRNISAEPGDVVLDVTQNTLNKVDNNSDNNFSNNLILTVKQQDFINETNTSHTKNLTIPMSEVVRIAYLIKNYYDKTTSDSRFGVTVTKQTTAESGSAVTYVVKQNGTQVGTKINIPKDFLVKSAELKTVTTKNQPVSGYLVGDKYIDFIINASDNSETNQHIYLNVKDLVDVYTADESSLTVSNNKFSIKSGGVASTHLNTALQNLINSKIDTPGTGLSKTDTTLSVKLSSAIDSSNETTAATPKAVKDALAAAQDYVDQKILGVLDPNGIVRLEIATKADADHTHGNITKNGYLKSSSQPDGVPNAIAITNNGGQIVAATSISKSKISDFAHDQASSTITDTATYTNIGNTTQTQSGINSAINTKLGNKVDKVSGKGLSTNDFTDALKTKLNGIAEGANKYVHPTQSALTGKPSSNQLPNFGSTFTISQVVVNTMGHVTGLNDIDIKIPNTVASDSTNGLMPSSMYTKLNGVAYEANKYVHPTQTAITGKPDSNQTPSFGSTFIVPQVIVNSLGHVTGINEKSVTIPSTKGNNNTFGLVKITDSYTDSSATASSNIAASGKAVNDAYTTLNSNITTVSNNLSTLTNKYNRSSDVFIRIIRTQSSGVLYPNMSFVEEFEGTRLVVNNGDRLNVKVMRQDGQNISGAKVRLIMTYQGNQTIKEGTTNSAGMLDLSNTLGLINGIDGVAYAILKGTEEYRKDIDISWVEYGNGS